MKDRWGYIQQVIELNGRVEQRLEQSVIAALVLTGTSATDDAKIFEIINTGGTRLTAAEVLSANPQWSRELKNPHADLIADAKDLYATMGIRAADGVARWDVAATLLSRISARPVFGSLDGKTPKDDTRQFERKPLSGSSSSPGGIGTRSPKTPSRNSPPNRARFLGRLASLRSLYRMRSELRANRNTFSSGPHGTYPSST